jgi:hypothetical protein
VRVTLRQGQDRSWGLGEAAAAAGLQVVAVAACHAEAYPGYVPRRGARDDSFPTDGSVVLSLEINRRPIGN